MTYDPDSGANGWLWIILGVVLIGVGFVLAVLTLWPKGTE